MTPCNFNTIQIAILVLIAISCFKDGVVKKDKWAAVLGLVFGVIIVWWALCPFRG